MVLLGLLASSPALALTAVQSGPGIDLAAGLGVGGHPVGAAVGGQLSLGWWTGTYDDQYAFGRYWWVGPTGRVDWRPDTLRIAPLLEIRRGIELIVVGLSFGAAAGPLVRIEEASDVGWTARAIGQAKLRRSRFWGFSLRLEAGVDVIGDQAGFTGAVLRTRPPVSIPRRRRRTSSRVAGATGRSCCPERHRSSGRPGPYTPDTPTPCPTTRTRG
jgi:hypothetical protein